MDDVDVGQGLEDGGGLPEEEAREDAQAESEDDPSGQAQTG